jgi:Putative prokaryotic signal transducing protein
VFLTQMDDLVTVASFPDVAEAELARQRLELEGIRAFVIDGYAAGVMPYLASATSGVRVQVEPGNVERAKEILTT